MQVFFYAINSLIFATILIKPHVVSGEGMLLFSINNTSFVDIRCVFATAFVLLLMRP